MQIVMTAFWEPFTLLGQMRSQAFVIIRGGVAEYAQPLCRADWAVAIACRTRRRAGRRQCRHWQKIFRKCAACHSLEPGKKKIGPSLHGLIGRTAGTVKGYRYSKAMKAHGSAGMVWRSATLDTYLTAPRKVVPGTKMTFPGLKSAQDRADIIAYLKRFSG